MTFEEYQRLAARTMSVSLPQRDQLIAAALGLVGEAAECSEQIKKYAFHGHEINVEALRKELGDVLWYAAALASALDLALDDVAAANIEKLRRRYPDGFSPDASRLRAEDDR